MVSVPCIANMDSALSLCKMEGIKDVYDTDALTRVHSCGQENMV
jgi:hypothetical protein